MDGEQLFLSDAEKAYYRAFEDMFNSAGWRMFSDELASETDKLPEESFWNAKSYDEIVIARVKAVLHNTIINYPKIIEQRKLNVITNRASLAEELAEGQRSNV